MFTRVIHGAILNEIVQLISPIDAAGLRLLCKSAYASVSSLKWPAILEQRLKEVIRQWGVDPDILGPLLHKSSACLTGSFMLGVLLGEDVFQPNDLDIFVPYRPSDDDASPTLEFPELLRYLFRLATGVQSSCSNPVKFDQSRIASGMCSLRDEALDYCDENIERVVGYNIGDRTVQVIQMNNIENMDEYVQRRFDFRCITSTWDGTTFRVRHAADVGERRLILTPAARERIYADDLYWRRHRGRVAKYEARGFMVS